MGKNEKQTSIIDFVNDVIDKKFSIASKGYDPREVDKTLDEILEQFRHYINEFNSLDTKYMNLYNEFNESENTIAQLKEENDELKYKLKRLEESGIYSNLLMDLIEKNKNEDTSTHSINQGPPPTPPKPKKPTKA